MNILKRNKELVARRNTGERLASIAKDYGVCQATVSLYYYRFYQIVNKPYYDMVAALDLNDQVAVKLLYVLSDYEDDVCCELDAEFIRHIKRDEFALRRGVGPAIMSGFDILQKSLKK